MSYLKLLAQIGFILIILYSFYHRVRTGFWVPKYIHFIALFMLLVAGLFTYLTFVIKPDKVINSIYFLGFPISVYLLYGLYGGGINSKEKNINDGLVIDRAMNEKEVTDIFKEYFFPYTEWSFENLLLFSYQGFQSIVEGKSGKSYKLEIESEPYDDDSEKIVAIYGRLTEQRKLYKPESHIVFEISKNGTVFRNGLEPNS